MVPNGHVSLGTPEAIPERITTERMAPLLPDERTRRMRCSPPGTPIAVIDETPRDNVTFRPRESRDLPDLRTVAFAFATAFLLALVFGIQLAVC